MTKRDLLGVAIRILGLTIFVQMIIGLPGLAWIFVPFVRAEKIMILLSVFQIVVTGLVGIILMIRADGIASKLVAEDSKLDWPEWICDKAVLFDFGTRIYGVVLLATSVPIIIARIVGSQIMANQIRMPSELTWTSILGSLIQVIFGLCLIVGMGRIAEYIKQIIRSGRKLLEGPNV